MSCLKFICDSLRWFSANNVPNLLYLAVYMKRRPVNCHKVSLSMCYCIGSFRGQRSQPSTRFRRKNLWHFFVLPESVLKYLNANLYTHFEIRNGREVEGRIPTSCPALTNTSFPRSSQQMVRRQSSLCLVSYFLTESESLVPQF